MAASDHLEQVHQLTDKIDRLCDVVRRLLDENRSLRTSQDQLIGERAALLTKNEQARSRVEAMIQRLKSLEHNA
ncbi:TIGR02449 family protein [Chiayiivirga flava]|uniref:Cell division protein ZapB n=1 Tax=Chiayiivirga flava TaxID=659595 RepID=A0A7W8D4W1_9GAMM|nr:TIGR02449 family protein [Chiayiivirga flava]MBB5207974.1 cell division protein ZapB [Chiayiivirga flava]